ncbi:enoyl-CoA hydratase/isomerase family protein [Castellaniella sp.]|uniref:enoyl-CoA hydratase/isomerase family protein n=1 Tax=Castellaniella sp. TaxID=1955812 RepID=UPI003569C3E3
MAATVLISYPVQGVGVLTLSRVHKHNAIDPATSDRMAECLNTLERDDQVRCIVLTGAGDKAFCAGADIIELLPHLRSSMAAGTYDPQFCGVTHRSVTSKPLLAAINGVALGGGLELALACDLRIASSNARFGLPEITVGVLAGGGGCTRLPRTIPSALAAEMILTGRSIDAERALQAGLISEITTPETLLERALDMAQTIAARAPRAVRACTRLLRHPRYTALAEDLALETREFAAVLQTRDADEGIRAFAEKRVPVYGDH